jgi:hypothetical protein
MLTRIWNAVFTNKAPMWTAIFTGVLTVCTYLMVSIYTTISDTTKKSERAFVSFAGLGVGPRMRDTSGWVGDALLVSWNNSGTTPAKNLVLQMNATPWPVGQDLPGSYEFPMTPEKSRGIMSPKGGYQTQRVISNNILYDNWHGKTQLFLWGTMVYSDIFEGDPDRLSEFCVEISQITVSKATPTQSVPVQPPKVVIANPSVGTVPVPKPLDISDADAAIVGLTFQACNQHNCYDEECKDYKERIKDMR